MIPLALGFAFVVALLRWLFLDQVGYAPLRRRIRRGDIDVRASSTVRPFHLNTMGSNPTVHYRYAMIRLGPGEEAVLEGVAGAGAYTSVTLYDELLQSLIAGPDDGDVHRRLPPGPFTLTVRRGGGSDALDAGDHAAVVWFERHHGEPPAQRTTVRLRADQGGA